MGRDGGGGRRFHGSIGRSRYHHSPLRDHGVQDGQGEQRLKYLHLIVTGVTGLLLIFGSLDMPDTGDPESPPSLHVSPRYIEQGYSETSTPNMVTAVLADYRGFDTLGETVVIFTAALGVILILRTRRDED